MTAGFGGTAERLLGAVLAVLAGARVAAGLTGLGVSALVDGRGSVAARTNEVAMTFTDAQRTRPSCLLCFVLAGIVVRS